MLPQQDRHVIFDPTKTTFGRPNSAIRINSASSFNSSTKNVGLKHQRSTSVSSSSSPNVSLSTHSNSTVVRKPKENDLILQTRRLTGDASRKGEAWWKICQLNENGDSSSSQTSFEDDGNTESNTISLSQGAINTKAQQPSQPHKEVRNNNKVYIVPSKKAQYGHLLSNHGEAARIENQSPIVYRRPERGRKEVAPLWYHPFSADG